MLYRDEGGRRLFLLLDYGRYWDYAKGHVEEGEDDLRAARRELEEETGILQVDLVDGFAKPITYFFHHPDRGLVRKTVVFFLGSTRTAKVRISHEHTGYAWVEADEAMRRLRYPTARKVLAAAISFLGNR